MAQPYDFPEQLLAGKEEYYIRHKLEKQGLGKGGISAETLKEYIRCCTPENIHGVCEDYRAAAGIDLEMDTQDFAAGRKIECPVLVIVGGQSHTSKFYGFEDAWSGYAANVVRCIALPPDLCLVRTHSPGARRCGHHAPGLLPHWQRHPGDVQPGSHRD